MVLKFPMKNKVVLLVAVVLILVFSAVVYAVLPNLLVRIATVEITYDSTQAKETIVLTPDYYTRTLSVSYKNPGVEKKSIGVIGDDFYDRMENILKTVRGKGSSSCEGLESYHVAIAYSKQNWGIQNENICVNTEHFSLLNEFYKNVVDLFSHDVY